MVAPQESHAVQRTAGEVVCEFGSKLSGQHRFFGFQDWKVGNSRSHVYLSVRQLCVECVERVVRVERAERVVCLRRYSRCSVVSREFDVVRSDVPIAMLRPRENTVVRSSKATCRHHLNGGRGRRGGIYVRYCR